MLGDPEPDWFRYRILAAIDDVLAAPSRVVAFGWGYALAGLAVTLSGLPMLGTAMAVTGKNTEWLPWAALVLAVLNPLAVTGLGLMNDVRARERLWRAAAATLGVLSGVLMLGMPFVCCGLFRV